MNEVTLVNKIKLCKGCKRALTHQTNYANKGNVWICYNRFCELFLRAKKEEEL